LLTRMSACPWSALRCAASKPALTSGLLGPFDEGRPQGFRSITLRCIRAFIHVIQVMTVRGVNKILHCTMKTAVVPKENE
jgi:hypothetical protein